MTALFCKACGRAEAPLPWRDCPARSDGVHTQVFDTDVPGIAPAEAVPEWPAATVATTARTTTLDDPDTLTEVQRALLTDHEQGEWFEYRYLVSPSFRRSVHRAAKGSRPLTVDGLRALADLGVGSVRYTPSTLPEPSPAQDPRLSIWQVRGDTLAVEVEPLVDQLLWPGGKFTLVSPPKVGKSFLAIALSAALRNEDRFLGLAVEPTSVLYLTEEPASTFDVKLERFGILPGDDGFRFIRRSQPEVSAMPWQEVVDRVALAAEAWGSELVVVDVLHRWAGFDEEGENRSGVVGPAIQALSPLTEAGAAVLILHHAPWTERRARGSTDIHGASDNVLYLERDENAATLTSLGGRFAVLENDQRISFRIGEDGRLESIGPERLGAASKTARVIEVVNRSEEPVSTTDLASELGWSDRVARKWAERAHQHGRLGRETGPHGEYKWRPYSLADLADELDRYQTP